jgi:hypothetical protein
MLPAFIICVLNSPGWLSSGVFWTAFFTFVIATATIAYVVITQRLWIATKAAADAASLSAEAARKSADATTEAAGAATRTAEVTFNLHRPFVGVPSVILKHGWSTRTWDVAVMIRNYGTLPATKVRADVEFLTDESPRATVTRPSSVEIFPQAEYESLCRFDMGDPDQQAIHSESRRLSMKIRIAYEASDGRRFTHAVSVSYSGGIFIIDKSETQNA